MCKTCSSLVAVFLLVTLDRTDTDSYRLADRSLLFFSRVRPGWIRDQILFFFLSVRVFFLSVSGVFVVRFWTYHWRPSPPQTFLYSRDFISTYIKEQTCRDRLNISPLISDQRSRSLQCFFYLIVTMLSTHVPFHFRVNYKEEIIRNTHGRQRPSPAPHRELGRVRPAPPDRPRRPISPPPSMPPIPTGMELDNAPLQTHGPSQTV